MLNHDFQWALDRARKERPDLKWQLGSFNYGLDHGLAGKTSDGKRYAEMLAYEGNGVGEPSPPWNLNDLSPERREEWWTDLMSNIP